MDHASFAWLVPVTSKSEASRYASPNGTPHITLKLGMITWIPSRVASTIRHLLSYLFMASSFRREYLVSCTLWALSAEPLHEDDKSVGNIFGVIYSSKQCRGCWEASKWVTGKA